MKKLYSSPKRRRYIQIRQKDALRRKLELRSRPSASRGKPSTYKSRGYYARLRPKVLTPPSTFSLLNNPGEVITFVQASRRELESYGNVYSNFRKVESLTPETLTFLISMIEKAQRGKVHKGVFPDDRTLTRMFLDSGITEYFIPVQQGPLPPRAGNIRRRQDYRVDGEIADQIIAFAESRLGGDHAWQRSVYAMIIELMANTRNHASRSESGERWWLSAYHRKDTDCVSFTFVDTGVGIFNSVSATMSFRRKAQSSIGWKTNAQFMEHMLLGKIGSKTKLEHRGKGIPRIYEFSAQGLIQNLTVLTNDVFAKVSKADYGLLKQEFPGTLWYWEVGKSNGQCNQEERSL